MSSGQRPGGLTALAVVNFLLGVLGVIGTLTMSALLEHADAVAAHASAQDRLIIEALQGLGTGSFVLILAVNAATALLLVLSGIGYLRLRRFLGRALGNVYAVTGIGGSLLGGLMLPPALGGGFDLGSMLNLVYPALTLIMLNTVFKHDFEP